MARQQVGPRTLRRWSKDIGAVPHIGWVRGNTGHRRDYCLGDNTIRRLWPDGTTDVEQGTRCGRCLDEGMLR